MAAVESQPKPNRRTVLHDVYPHLVPPDMSVVRITPEPVTIVVLNGNSWPLHTLRLSATGKEAVAYLTEGIRLAEKGDGWLTRKRAAALTQGRFNDRQIRRNAIEPLIKADLAEGNTNLGVRLKVDPDMLLGILKSNKDTHTITALARKTAPKTHQSRDNHNADARGIHIVVDSFIEEPDIYDNQIHQDVDPMTLFPQVCWSQTDIETGIKQKKVDLHMVKAVLDAPLEVSIVFTNTQNGEKYAVRLPDPRNYDPSDVMSVLKILRIGPLELEWLTTERQLPTLRDCIIDKDIDELDLDEHAFLGQLQDNLQNTVKKRIQRPTV